VRGDRDKQRVSSAGSGGFFFFVLHFLDGHIAEFVGVEDLSAIEAFDELGVIFARDNADLGMLTDRIHGVIRAVRVGMGQIVPGLGRLSTGMLGGLAAGRG
jgi:hypothetical protein